MERVRADTGEAPGPSSGLKVRLEVARALGKWEMVESLARTLTKLEPDESLHVFNLAQAMRQLEGHEAALAVYEFAAEGGPISDICDWRWPSSYAPLIASRTQGGC